MRQTSTLDQYILPVIVRHVLDYNDRNKIYFDCVIHHIKAIRSEYTKLYHMQAYEFGFPGESFTIEIIDDEFRTLPINQRLKMFKTVKTCYHRLRIKTRYNTRYKYVKMQKKYK
jgi:hypothetical protein